MLSFFLYRSVAICGPRSSDSALIYLQSANRNRASEVTGYLHREGPLFFQYLEGPEATLSEARDRIGRDPRHRDVTILAQGRIASRVFTDWEMAFTDDWDQCYRAYGGEGIAHVSPFQIICFMKYMADSGAAAVSEARGQNR